MTEDALMLPKEAYESLKARAIAGWHTWNVRSVLSHVYLPEGFALNLAMKEYRDGAYLKEALIGRQGKRDEQVIPGLHDGSYSSLELRWRDIHIQVESLAQGDDLLLLITPIKTQRYPAMLVLESGMLYNRPGAVSREGNSLRAQLPGKAIEVYALGEEAAFDPHIPVQGPYLTLALSGRCAFAAGQKRSFAQVAQTMEKARTQAQARFQKDEAGQMQEVMTCAINWDTIYDARMDRIITPVSRIWSIGVGGYVLFCWDNYFAGALAATFDKAIAYSNLWEITGTLTRDGFVPNLTYATGQQSWDRSQPPVGSAMVYYVYRMHKDRWLVEALYPALLRWNTWFFENRSQKSGALSWGSNPFEPVFGNYWEENGVNERFGAALESGLDNSPMYDDIPFDQDKHLLCLEDVGLTGLFIWDCDMLAELAAIQGLQEDIALLMERKRRAQAGLSNLWDEEQGFFFNRRTDTGEFSRRISPTNFYALFSDQVTPGQVERITAHYLDPKEFYGDWMLPSIARNDPAYGDQDYWRGRIWAPMNFLCYLAAVQRGAKTIRQDIASKSKTLLLKEWERERHVHENYNADTGEGCDAHNSDRFYHWGALLSLIAQMENGGALPWLPEDGRA